MTENSAGSRWSGTLGCIADDLTGATDLAGAIQRGGLDVRLCFGVPEPHDLDRGPVADVVVIALPVRSVAPDEARAVVGAAMDELQRRGITRFYDKYCSTFDSTDAGNIGPVADEVLARTGVGQCVHVPSYPENGRTVYQGHLFVGEVLLENSALRDHPRNPMTDSDLVRVLGKQTDGRVGLLSWQDQRRRADALAELVRGEDVVHVVADAIDDDDIDRLAGMVGDRLAAGGAPFGAAVARSLFAGRGARGRSPSSSSSVAPPAQGHAAVVVGSASRVTREQVARFSGPVLEVSLAAALAAEGPVDDVVRRAADLLSQGPVLVRAQQLDASWSPVPGPPAEAEAAAMEKALGRVARGLVGRGVDRLVVAGGETSGAVAASLGLRSVAVQCEIAPGVPWNLATDRPLAVAFKSGNFGGPDFFEEALAQMVVPGR